MIVLQLLALFYSLWIPGLVVVWNIDHEWEPWIAWMVALAVGSLCIPMLSFCVAWILGTHLSLPLVVAVASAVNVPGVAWWWFKRPGG